MYHAFESQCRTVHRATELQSSRAAEQQSSRAAEQQSSRAAEQQSSRGKFLFTLLAVVFMSFFTNFSLWGEIPVQEKLIEIVDFEVITGDTTNVGDTIQVSATFISQVDAKVRYGIALNGEITMLGDTLKDYVETDTLSVERDSSNTLVFYLLARDVSFSTVGFGVTILSDDPYVQFPSNLSSVDVATSKDINIGPYVPDWTCNKVFNTDVLCATYELRNLSPFSFELNDKTTMNVNGSVIFDDWYEPTGATDEYPVRKGALTNVWLFFRSSNEPSSYLFHPVPIQTVPIEGTHYVRCSEDGSFSFNFEYYADSLINHDPEAIWEMILFVAKENEAIRIYSTTNHSDITNIANPDRSGTTIKVYSRFIKVEDDESNLEPIEFRALTLEDDEGVMFRHTTLSRRFLIERREIDEEDIDTEVPPQVQVTVQVHATNSNRYNGDIVIVHRPDGTKTRITAGLMSHEYAHHYHSFLGMEGDWPIIEGWGMFYMNAFTSWELNKYGDRKDHGDDGEMGPYTSFTQINTQTQEVVSQRARFGNMSKVTETSFSSPIPFDMCRFACYLWNIYDSFNDGDFMNPRYEGYNNDDVNGLGKDVFDYFVYYNQNYAALASSYPLEDPENEENDDTPLAFHYFLKEILGASSVELQASIQQVYDFLDFRETTLAKVTNEEMRSPQIDVGYTHDVDNLILGFTSRSYPASVGEGEDTYDKGNLHASWLYNFSNRETGVIIYHKNVDIWEFDRFINYSSSNYSTLFNNISFVMYKISANKTGGGDSYLPHFKNTPGKIGVYDENEFGIMQNIYPNPASFFINFESSELKNKYISYQIYDLSANLVYAGKANASSNKLYVGLPIYLSNGTYFVKAFESDNGQLLFNETFIIQR